MPNRRDTTSIRGIVSSQDLAAEDTKDGNNEGSDRKARASTMREGWRAFRSMRPV